MDALRTIDGWGARAAAAGVTRANAEIAVHGPRDAAARGALVSFALKGVHPHDVSEIIGRKGVCVRAGHHCAQPLMQHLGESATTRASFAVHTTRDEIDQLVDALGEVRRIFA